jgi:hypothetical protein
MKEPITNRNLPQTPPQNRKPKFCETTEAGKEDFLAVMGVIVRGAFGSRGRVSSD